MGSNIKKFKVTTNRFIALPIYLKGDKTACIFLERNYNFEISQEFKGNLKGGYEEKKGLLMLYETYKEKFNDMEKDWESYRGSKFSTKDKSKASSKMSVLDSLNFNNKLFSQMPWNKKYTVVYNKSGQEVKCAVLITDRIVYEDTTQYYYASSKEEAYYLCGVLNSDAILEFINKSGIKSERDIHKKIFDAPFPNFNSIISEHAQIATISLEISEKVERDDNVDDLLTRLNKLCSELLKMQE
jgi:hypothetical protein